MRSENATIRLLSIITLAALSVQFAWSQTVQVLPDPKNVTAGGGAFDVTVQIAGVSNLQASHVEFTFDNTLLQYDGVTRGSVMNGTYDVFKNAPAPGPAVDKVTVDQAVIGATPADGNGSLFTISFIPLKGGSATIGMSATLRDPLNNPISATVSDGHVSIVNPAPTLTGISPTSKNAGDAGFTLTVNGTNFVNGVSAVKLDGNARTTTFVSSTELQAAVLASDLLTAGSRSITVTNPAPGGGTTSPQTLTVNPASTTTAISGSPNPSSSGQSVLFTATVTPSAATGSVQFLEGATVLGSGTISSGTATFSTSALTPGVHTIKAVYSGDADYVTSENTTSQTVNPVISASAGANGSIDPTGSVVVSYDGSQTFNFTPAAHYHVADVLVDGVSQGAPASYTFNNVTANRTISVTFAIDTYTLGITAVNGSVTKNPDKTVYDYGDVVTLTATPNTAYRFVGWEGDASGSANPTTVTMDGNKTVTANFAMNNYPLTTSVVGTGTISRNPNQASYDYNTSVELTANPGTGYDFTGWSGDLTGTTNPASVVMTGPKSVTATFTIKTFTITVTAGTHGSITPAGPTTVNYGADQLYTISPNPGYHVIDVKVDNVSQGAITSYNFPGVTANHSIEATFGINSYTITVSAGSNGTIAPAGPDVSVNHGDNQLFTFTPAAGYHVATLTVDGVRINPQASYTFPGVTGNHSIGVTFAVDNYAITGPAEYNLDVDGNSVTDMKVNVTTKPAGDATISAIAYVANPAGLPGMPAGGLPFYLVVASTLPEHQFEATVRLDLNGIAGFGSTSSLAYYNEVTSNWILVDGTYLASDPVFGGHPSFLFQTDHFTPFVFFAPDIPPVHLYGSSASDLAARGIVVPNNSWRPAGPTYGGTEDWSWSGSQTVSLYLVPEPAAQFGTADITLAWDATQLSLSGVDFGSAPEGLYASGHGYSPSTIVTMPYGAGKVRIQCTRGDGGNFTIIGGEYIARVNFTILKPGHTPVAIIGADFTIQQGNQKPYLIPVQAEVKAYLADVVSAGNENSGDGKVDFEDLVMWSYSYWAGVPGYSGSAPYMVKYDFGPTADNYIFSLPQPDGKIDFEDLLIFSIGYGQSAGHYLPKIAVPASATEISLGAPVAKGDEVDIPVVLGGSVTDVRGLKVEVGGQFGAFLGAEKGELLKSYASPVPMMHRTEGRSVYLDLAVMGLDAKAIDQPGEVAVLRFGGAPRIQLNAYEARGSRNNPIELKKVKGAGEVQPTEFALLQNYPNPFNPTTTIEYQLPAASMTNIEIYNMLGERVATLVHEMQSAGFYTVQWNGTNDSGAKVATGVYFYRMQADKFSLVKKMLLVK